MTDDMMALRGLLEKSSDADLLREMIGFTAQRLMALEVEGLTGASHGERSLERINQRNGYVKVRQAGRIVSVAVIVAVAVNDQGRREVLGMTIGASEAETFWTEFLRALTRRGLRGVKLVISDAHEGLKAAAARVLNATWQRCRVHFMRNLLAHAGKSGRRVVAAFNKMMVLELARCEYIERRENVIALGNSGTGKTHIALGLGLAACQKGLTVGFITAAALVHELIEARDEKRLLRFQKQLAKYKLLIIDELGFVPLSKTGAELLFEVFSQRYEGGSTLVTSNLPFDEWTEVFGSERLTGALLDRLTHHVHILEMNGDSYRLNQSQKRRKPPKT